MPLRIVAVAILHLFKATIRFGNNAGSRERVVPVARYVAQEETSQERNKGREGGFWTARRGGGEPARGGRWRWGVRIPQTMSRFLIPVLLYLRRLRSRGRPKQLKFDFCPYRTLPFATTYRSQAKDDVSLPRGRRRWQKHKKEVEEP